MRSPFGRCAARRSHDRAALTYRHAARRGVADRLFLGGQALTRHGIDAFALVALTAFAASVLLCVSVLLPKDDLVFSLDATEAYRTLYGDAGEPLEVQRRLADTLQVFRTENQPELTKLFRRFRWASLALGIEVLAWALELALS